MKKIFLMLMLFGSIFAIETNSIYYLKHYQDNDATRRAVNNDELLRTFEIRGFGEILFFQKRVVINTSAQLLNNKKDGKRVILEFKGERLFNEKVYKINLSTVKRLGFLNEEHFCKMIFLFENDDYKDITPTDDGYTIFLTE